MNDKSNYSSIIISKSGIKIPVFTSGKTVDSRYDPLRESLRLVQEIKDETNFVIILGIASGSLIKTLLEHRNNIFILAVEINQDDINFLMQLEEVEKLSKNKNICFSTISDLFEKITQQYVPAFYGNLQVIEQRGWTAEHNAYIAEIKEILQKAIGIVSADFSVQSHFGKLWQHNILSNIKLIKSTRPINEEFFPPNKKTALILAAGPSIDKRISSIKRNLNDYYLIATDTAFSILLSYQIIPHVVISIDGQNLSTSHFIHSKEFDFSNTLFLFDLCANDSAVKKIISQKGNISYFTSGHPLSEYINESFCLGIPKLFSGAGTVTISAVSFALEAGFENIFVAGADFAYSNGKPYAKGTYLDRLYNQKSIRINNSQKEFCSLMYRTPLTQVSDSLYTTKILNAYKSSFEEYLAANKLDFYKEDDFYKIKNSYKRKNSLISDSFNKTKEDGEEILKTLIRTFAGKKSDSTFNSFFDLTKSDICLLPLISWLKNNDNKDKKDFNYFYKKALGEITK